MNTNSIDINNMNSYGSNIGKSIGQTNMNSYGSNIGLPIKKSYSNSNNNSINPSKQIKNFTININNRNNTIYIQ